MRHIKRTLILVGLLSFGLAGIGLSGKGVDSLKSRYEQEKNWVLVSGGLIGTFSFGGIVLETCRRWLMRKKKEKNLWTLLECSECLVILGSNVSGCLLSIWAFMHGVEKLHKLYSIGSPQTAKKKNKKLPKCFAL